LLRRYFMHPEFKALLETVGPKGEFIDTNATRTINPGHCIETAWFIMEEAKLRNWDKDLLDTALTIFDWSWDWGWDKQYGGIINFRDSHFPDQDYPEWYGYLHRDGTVAQPAKGNIFKGPFHVPRMMIKGYMLCQEILKTME